MTAVAALEKRTAEKRMSADVLDALTELTNIGVGRAASALSDLIGSRIDLNVPAVRFANEEDERVLTESPSVTHSTIIAQEFRGRITGRAALVFPRTDGLVLAQLLTGESAGVDELDVELAGVLLELGNIVLNGVMGSYANVIEQTLDYTIPELLVSPPVDRETCGATFQPDDMLVADVLFAVKPLDIHGSIVIVFSWGSIQALLEALGAR